MFGSLKRRITLSRWCDARMPAMGNVAKGCKVVHKHTQRPDLTFPATPPRQMGGGRLNAPAVCAILLSTLAKQICHQSLRSWQGGHRDCGRGTFTREHQTARQPKFQSMSRIVATVFAPCPLVDSLTA